jgi:tetratricopeptide (TPR) repeat protein
MTSTGSNDDDDDSAKMARDDRAWDGNWSSAGLSAMFVELQNPYFEEEQWEDFLEEQKEISSLRAEEEFINLDIPGEDEESWARLHMQVLHPRGLVIASLVMRRVAEGICPKRIRIRKMDDTEFNELMEHKKAGNEAFSKKRYKEAIEKYEEALLMADSSFVAPKSQMDQIVTVISNQAECYLRLKKYKDAGQTATDALLLDSGHAKSRMRRAKAELAIAGASHLLQAQIDLEEIVNNDGDQKSREGIKQAKEYLEQLDEILQMEKTALLEKHGSDYDWDLYVRMMKSKCW